MGERPSELRGSDLDLPNYVGNDDVTDVGVDLSDEAERNTKVETLKDEIEQTRTDMSYTIDQIQEKLNPQHVMEQVKDTVKEATVGRIEDMVTNVTDTAKDAGSGIMDTIKSNPVPALLVGASLGWLLLRSNDKKKSNPPQRYYPTGAMNPPNYSEYPMYYAEQEQDKPGMIGRVVDSIKQNPIPAAIAGVSIGYMVMQNQSSSTKQSSGGGQPVTQKMGNMADKATNKMGDVADQATQKMGDVAHDIGDKASDLAGKATDKAKDIAGGVTDTVGNVAHGIGDTAGNVMSGIGDTAGNVMSGIGDTAGNVAHGVQHTAERAQNQFERMLRESPLIVGAAALVLGVAVGMMLPGTTKENELMGETKDNLLDKAKQAVSETAEKVGNVAGATVDKVQETVRQEAENQGLTDKPNQPANPDMNRMPGMAGMSEMRGATKMPGMDGSGATPVSRPYALASLTTTQLSELQQQATENNREGFNRLSESYGWNRQVGDEIWRFMTHSPDQNEVSMAFENQSGQNQPPVM